MVSGTDTNKKLQADGEAASESAGDFVIASTRKEAYSSSQSERKSMSDNVPPINNPAPPPPPPPPPQYSEAQARTWNMWCHIAALAGIPLPVIGNIVGPILVWQIKKTEFPSVEAHGKAALNFQLTLLILAVVISVAGFILSFFCVGFLFFLLLPLVWLAGIVFPIIAGMKANEGKEYKYPYSLTLV